MFLMSLATDYFVNIVYLFLPVTHLIHGQSLHVMMNSVSITVGFLIEE